MNWRIHHKKLTASTNLDAMSGSPGDVFTADFQFAGRGRLEHKWHSSEGENLMMSAVLSVKGIPAERAATIPLAVGLAVAEAFPAVDPMIKWPNDILANGRKLAGILCERHGENVIAGIGVNVNETSFPSEIALKATSLAILLSSRQSIDAVRDSILEKLASVYGEWRFGGLDALADRLSKRDFLKGKTISVIQTDDDSSPVEGLCGGIASDGSLLLDGAKIWAGEAHIAKF